MRKHHLLPIFVSVAAWNFGPSYLEAQIDVAVVSESIVRVRAYQQSQVAVEGTGFVINETGHVLTNAHLLEKAERITVSALESDAVVVAEQVFSDREINLALLLKPNLNLPPLRLSEKATDSGRTVQTLRFGVMGNVWLSQGTIGAYETIFDQKSGRSVGRLLQHNALITTKAFGMPLFNECGDVVAINSPNPRSGPWPYRTSKPKGAVFALSSMNIIAALDHRKITHQAVNSECLSVLERAERAKLATADSLKLARAEVDSARKAAKEAEEKIKAARKEAERVKTQADPAKRAAAKSLQVARAEAESLKTSTAPPGNAGKVPPDSLLASKAEAESLETAKVFPDPATDAAPGSRKEPEQEIPVSLKWGIPIGGALVLLILLGWLLANHRRKEQLRSAESRLSAVQQAAAAAPKPAPFRCLLEGRDSSGRQFALTISALALSDPAGVRLGRNPSNADFVVDHEEVSREHLRLRCTGGTLYAEDLNALNGTRVNGRLLNPEERAALQDGDRLETGPVVFSVRLVPE